MAETMTYDPATDTVTQGDNLTPEEQQSLEVGEKLAAEQDNLILGKYKNAEELEKAHVELQKKLGEQTESKTEETKETTEEKDVNSGVTLITDASTEYAEKGEVSQETLAKFSEMSSADLVKSYIEMQANLPQQQAPVELSDGEVNSIKNSVGGEKGYSDLVNWATTNVDKPRLEAFNNLLNSGDVAAVQLAVDGMKAQYDNVNGYEGRMLSGKQPSSSGDIFRSQAELVAAMGDPRYNNDPAYRQDVIAKLERSDNLQF